MEKESLKIKAPLLKENCSQNGLSVTFDIPNLIEQMKHQHIWTKGKPNSMILLKCPDKQMVLIAMHEGSGIKSFQSNDSVTFQIIEGKLKIHTRNDSVTLGKDQLLTLHDNIKYSLTTKEETVFILTIANGLLQYIEN